MNKITMIMKYLKGNRLTYAGALAAVVLNAGIATLFPQIIRIALDSVIGGKAPDLPAWASARLSAWGGIASIRADLWILLAVLLALACFQGLFQFLRGKLAAVTGENASKRMRDRLFGHILRQPFSYHAKIQTGDIIQRCTSDIETVQNFVAGQSIDAGSIVVQVLLVMGAMLLMNVPYTLVSIALIPLMMVLTIRFFRSMMTIFLETDESEGVVSAVLQENLTGVRVVKAFAAQTFEIGKFDEANRTYRDNVMKIIRLMADYWSQSDFLCMTQYAAVVIAGAWWAARGTITFGTLVAFTTYAGMLIWPIRSLGQMMGFMGQAFVSLKRIQEILDAPQESYDTGESGFPVSGHIVFDHVRFGYSPDRLLLEDISLEIKPGSTVAFMGATGSGKSTLAHLLLRFYDYQGGSVRIDGVELSAISRNWIRQQIGIVLQEPFLFSRTLSENIRIGQHGVSEDDVASAAAVACVDESIREFPDGYRTPVGERGVTLSGGQRQRVAIARTVLRDVPILIFDDSLSSVDTETDMAIRASLRERRRLATTLIISHRITTLSEADQIYVLDQGHIVQRGTHEDLIHEEGPYLRIWQIQSENTDPGPRRGGFKDSG